MIVHPFVRSWLALSSDTGMELNKTNFVSSFPFIQAAIYACDFIAIDTELSGGDLYSFQACTQAM